MPTLHGPFRLAVRGLLIPTVLGVASLLGLPYTETHADHAPGPSSYYSYNTALIVGPNGTWLLGSSGLPATYLALSDASNHFSARTGYSRVLVGPTPNYTCGYSYGCIFFDERSTVFDWAPS